jgi:hypothetical protein
MALSAYEKEDILATLTIELERMFTVLSNSYSQTEDRSKFLSEIEAEIKATLAERRLIVAVL